MVQAIISIAHNLGLEVAEGVETEAQLAVLSDFGCETMQGICAVNRLLQIDLKAVKSWNSVAQHTNNANRSWI